MMRLIFCVNFVFFNIMCVHICTFTLLGLCYIFDDGYCVREVLFFNDVADNYIFERIRLDFNASIMN